MDWSRLHPHINPGVGRVRCEPGWRLDWRDGRLRDFDLWFVWAGRGKMELYDDRVVDLRPGVCFWMRPGHTYFAEQELEDRLGVSFTHFKLLGEDGGPRWELPPEIPEVTEVQDFAFFESCFRRIVQLIHEPREQPDRDEPARREEAQALLKGLLISVARGGERRPALSPAGDRHYRTMRALATRIRESPGTLPVIRELAREAGYGTEHFARVFREVNGVLPQEFIIQCRVERARQLLFESAMTVGEIADALGYRDIYFFSRQFKERTGLSPTALRNQRRGNSTF
jgi:AraC-like DNA-binding protein